MQFTAYDDDGNGYIDHVGWIVPHLSTQTFEIILTSNALRLDANKNTIEDIYSDVGAHDGKYVSVLNGQYVRVTFDHLLDNSRDITIFARPTDSGSTATVEVYTTDGTLIGTFPVIDQDGRYTLVLNNLNTPSDVFDLKVIGNIDIDYITDPNAYWVGGNGSWSDASHWSTSSDGSGAGSFGGIPNSTTNVTFNANSGAATTFVLIDVQATAGSFTVNGYTGTIVQNANLTVTNSGGQLGNYSQTSGSATFTAPNPGGNTLTVTGDFSVNSGIFKRYTGTGVTSDPYIIYDVYGLQGMKTELIVRRLP